MQKNKTSGMNTMKLSQTKKLYNEEIDIDISKIHSVLAGPKRPQDKVLLMMCMKKVMSIIKESNTS